MKTARVGRKPVKDKKKLVGIYLQESHIKLIGSQRFRDLFQAAADKEIRLKTS